MPTVHRATIEGPPLPAVAAGDVVHVPVFADPAGGSPYWMRVIEALPPNGRDQEVRGVRLVDDVTAHRVPEAERTVAVSLPLDRTARRVFEPVDQGVAQVPDTEHPSRDA